MIDRRELARALDRIGLAEWALVERAQQLAIADDAAPRVRRAETRTRWQLTVHADTPTGRGSAHVSIDASAGDVPTVVDQTVALARAAIGPAWQATPPAAPARVKLIDDELARGEPLALADGVARGLRAPDGLRVTPRISITREQVDAQTKSGLHASWLAALVRAQIVVASDTHALVVTREARRVGELELEVAIAAAAADLALLARAAPPKSGACALVLGPEALLHGGLGVWDAFAAQADAVVERQGLTRYREGSAIAPGADHVPDPLTIHSDGALDFGTRSAPIGDEGDAVRRFALVERGVAAGLGLSPREAALRHRDPNGGVRNLIVATGGWSGDTPPGRVVEIHRLRALAIDPYTGDASLEIALATDGGEPFTGGTIRLDLIDALARAQRGRAMLRRGAYVGPNAIVIERAELIA